MWEAIEDLRAKLHELVVARERMGESKRGSQG
jgi:hypothetical protein